jgi:pilus assembly protein CpaC
MKYLGLAVFVFVSWALVSEAQILEVGQQLKVPINGSVWIESKTVATGEITGQLLTLKAKKVGQTQYRIGDRSHQLTVLSAKQIRTKRFLQDFIKTKVGMHIEIQQASVHLSGTLFRIEDFFDLVEFCKSNECQYENKLLLHPDQFPLIQKKLKADLESVGVSSVVVSAKNPWRVSLSTSESKNPILLSVLAYFGIQAETVVSNVEISPVIKVHVTVAEVKKNALLSYGLKWPEKLGYKSENGRLISQIPAEFNLHALENQGLGRVLAKPNLICRSGETAEFLAGGEFPIKIINERMHDVIWKKYGVLLRVKPKADPSGRMSLGIEAEVSSIDPSRTIDGIPGMFTNRVSSYFDLTSSRWILLSGLLKNEMGSASQGLPGLSQIPILGALFSSKDFKNNRSELMIFVKPELLSSEESNPLESF